MLFELLVLTAAPVPPTPVERPPLVAKRRRWTAEDRRYCQGEAHEKTARCRAFFRWCSDERNAFTVACGGTPLVLSFAVGEQVSFLPASSRFPLEPGRGPTTMDWPAAPWLARDLDGDGAITSGRELFGSATRLRSGELARDGFEALAELDENHDGVVDAKDPAFSQLLAWNGAALRPLRELVRSMSLSVTSSPRCDQRGNCERERARLRWADASGEHDGEVVDVYPRLRAAPLAVVARE